MNKAGKEKEIVIRNGHTWNNAEADRIKICEYDPRWPSLFAAETKHIRAALPTGLEFTIEHFGSTAVPGVAAKPIIDIMLIVPEYTRWKELIIPLESIGYVYWASNPQPNRMFFVKGMPPYGTRRTHHVHVRKPSEVKRELLFRDYLTQHPKEAARYEMLKRVLASQYKTDREAYTRGKDAYIETVINKASP